MMRDWPPGAWSADVTVAIPARDAERTIGECLAAVRRLEPAPARVLVLNDRSADATAAIAAEHGAEVIKVTGGGLGRSRNLALANCATSHLAFLNADCYAEPDWLSVLLAAIRSSGAVIAGGRQVELRHGTIAERWKAVHLRQDAGDSLVVGPDFLSGGNMLLDLRRLDGATFDTQYEVAYEDVDFCRRVRRSGGILVYEPAARVVHDHMETLRSLPAKVWSYGAKSKSVGEVTTVASAVRAYVRMHSRPNDQTRLALSKDLRDRRLPFVFVDLLLLCASFWFFLSRALWPARSSGTSVRRVTTVR